MHAKTTQILKGASSYLTSGVLASIGTFVISIIVSRYLGKDGLGVLAVSLTGVLIGVVLSELGLNPLIMREFAPGARSRVALHSIILLRLAASVAISVCVLAAAFFFPSTIGLYSVVWGTALLIVSRSVGSGLDNFIKARLEHVTFLVLTISTTVAQVCLVYVILQAGSGISEAILTIAAVDIAKLAVLLFLSRHELVGIISHDSLSLTNLKPVLSQSAPFMLIGFLTVLGERVDILLLATLRNAAEAGVYSAADRFLVVGNLIDSALFASTLPILSSLVRGNEHRRVTRQIMSVTLTISIAVALILFFAAPLLIKATFRFSESLLLLQILSVSLPAMFANRVLRTALYSMERERLVAFVLAIVSLGSVALNVVFIPRYGPTAAAVVTVAGEFMLAFLYGGFYLKELGTQG